MNTPNPALTHKEGTKHTFLTAAEIPVYRFVGFDGNLCAAGAKSMGISKYNFDANVDGTAVIDGIFLIETGGSFSAGPITSDSTGRAVAATNVNVTVPVGSTNVTSSAAQPTLVIAGGVLPESINGYALDASSGSGKFVRAMLK